MLSLAQIKKPIAANLAEFDLQFRSAMQSDAPLLDKIVGYLMRTKGKQLRPVLVFLSAGLNGGITQQAYTAATLIEMLHTATLIHDDVVDESDIRRGFFSVKALWKNKVAVLVGDYLLSKGLLYSLNAQAYRLLHIVSDAVKNMSEGELLQIEKTRFLNISEKTYFEIISKKTASLIAACCAAGAASAGASEENIAEMKHFGELMGIAFQIKDDLLDFETGNKTGKPVLNDLHDRKISLPLIHALSKTDLITRKKMLDIVKNKGKNQKKVAGLIQFIEKNQGFEYANQKMEEYKKSALQILKSFPESEYKKSLQNLVNFTSSRQY